MSERTEAAQGGFWDGEDESAALQRYETFVNAVDDGLYQLDTDGTIVAVNDVVVRLTGYAREDLVGEHVSLLLETGDVTRIEYAIREQLLAGQEDLGTFEVGIETADGERRLTELHISLLIEDETFQGTVGVARDISDRSHGRDQVDAGLESSETVTSVLDEADVGVFILDEEFDVAWVDESVGQYFGIDREAVIGRDKRELIEETIRTRVDDDEAFVDTLLATYDDNSYVERFECRVTPDDSGHRWLEHRSRPIETGRYAGGRVELYYDVTEQRRRASQLQQLNEAVSEWLTESSHEAVARQASRHLEEILNMEINGIYLYDSAAGTLRPAGWTDNAETLFDELPTFAAGEGIAWEVFETGQPQVYDDVSDAPNLYNPGTPVSSEIVLPIGEHGVALIGSEEGNAFDDSDLMLAKIVASSLEATFDRISRKRRLERERDLTDRVLDATPVETVVLDADGEITRVNERAAEIFDVDDPATFSPTDRTMYDENGEPLSTAEYPYAQVLATGEPVFDRVVQVDRPDGERRWLSVNAVPITDEDGEIDRVVTAGEDVTDLKERERELETELSGIFGRVSDAFFALDETYRFTHVNASAEELLGHTEGELLDRRLGEVFPETDEIETLREYFDTAMETQDPTSLEHHSELLGFWIEATCYPSESGVSVYFRDISERKERERELERRTRQQQVVADLGQFALEVDDIDELMGEATNQVASVLDNEYCEVLDLDRDERELLVRQGVGWDEGVVGNATVDVDDDSQAGYTLLSEEPVVVEDLETETRFSGHDLLTSHGVTSGISTVIGSVDDPWGILGTHDTAQREFTDEDSNFVQSVANVLAEAIERHRYQAELEQFVDDLEESNERLEQFAYAASHDLQEPLRMVSSYLMLLESRYVDDLDEDAEEFIEFAVDGADRMREMIDGLLEYARVETRGKPLEPTDLETVLDDVLTDLQFKIEENDAEITREPLPDVHGDADQLRQVFQNLVENAVEYSGEEPPRIHVAAERDGDEWVLSVSDDGIGIDPEDADRVFQVFQRLHGREEHAGTGIGLALCDRIVERHGGDIHVESEPGEGSTFYLTIPVADGHES